MLIVTGTVEVDPERVDDLMEAVRTATIATRAEDGCIAYSFSVDLLDPSTVNVIERWRDQASLTAHLASEHIAAFLTEAGPAIRGMDVLKYEVASSGPVFE